VKNEKRRTCNITCVAMFTGEHPDEVLQKMFKRHGKNSKFQLQGNLIEYLEDHGFECRGVTRSVGKWNDFPRGDTPTKKELMVMRHCIMSKTPILYHMFGHYQILIGYIIDKEDKYHYIFNDPAGDRNKPVKERKRKSGYHVVYSEEKVLKDKIYGKCFAVGRADGKNNHGPIRSTE
jgi:hypothetical protein